MHLRVPVGVIEDAGVGRLQVDAQAASLGVEDEDKQIGAGRVEAVYVDHALHARRAPIQPHVPAQPECLTPWQTKIINRHISAPNMQWPIILAIALCAILKCQQ